MEIVQIVGIVFVAVVILILAYLYRESAIAEGKSEIAIGPVKFKLGGQPGKDDTPQGLEETSHSAVVTAGDENKAEHTSKE